MELRNKRHERFCREYVKDHNATKAYKRAGYKVSDSVARRNGQRLLTNADNRNFIIELEKKVIQKIEVETDEIYLGYRKLLEISGQTYEKKIGNRKRTVMLDNKNYKSTLDSLARIRGMFTDNLHVTGLTFAEALRRKKVEIQSGAETPKS